MKISRIDNQHGHKFLTGLKYQILLPAVICFLLCFFLIPQAYALYSVEDEMAMGANIHRQVIATYKLSNNPSDIKQINEIGGKIAKVCSRQELTYYFYVIDDEKIKNAFCIPGGYVYVFKGLMNMLSQDELAYVLAHEVGHVVSRHNIKRLQVAMGANLLTIASIFVPSDSPQFTSGVSFALGQVLSGYSRKDELEADSLAVDYLVLSGFNPKSGLDALEKLYQESKKNITPISYFRTHPYIIERISNIRKTLHLPMSVDDYMNK